MLRRMLFLKLSVIGALSVFIGFYSGGLFACEKHEKAALILKESSMGKKAQIIGSMTNTMLSSELFGQFSEHDRMLVRDILTREMDTAPLLDDMKNRLAKLLTLDDMDKLLSWLQSDLGQRMLNLENAALTSENMLMVFNQTDQIIADQQARLAIAEPVCDALKSEYLMAQAQNFMMNMLFVMMGQSETLSDNVCRSGADDRLKKAVHATFLQAYQHATDEELNLFKSFVMSRPALTLTSAVMDVLVQKMDSTVLAIKHKLYQEAEFSVDESSNGFCSAGIEAPVSCCCD